MRLININSFFALSYLILLTPIEKDIKRSFCSSKFVVTCHFTANRCCETFPECCETYPVYCKTFPNGCETFPICCEKFPVCCETFQICNQTFSVHDNGQDKVKGWVRGISLLGLGSKVVKNIIKELKKVLLL